MQNAFNKNGILLDEKAKLKQLQMDDAILNSNDKKCNDKQYVY